MSDQSIRIKDLPAEERPRERLVKKGPESLSNSELLAIILRTGTAKENVVTLCNRIFTEYSIKQLSQASLTKLMEIHGVGTAKAAQISAIFELARRLEGFCDEPRRKITSSADVYSILYPQVRELKKERLTTLHLDTKNNVIREEVVSIGTLNSNIVHPREIFKSALLESAASVILTHNHPSGDPSPSREDIAVTRKLVDGGKLLGIDVLDHVIIGDGRYVSLKDEGYIS
ncbi:DNA repair protein RadC [Methanohalophilus levihalophilus]|uniref:RadC family protein n=1 Tax=Methanohalophilus levihalophilus TaxID=1431282 RepID=UPI001AE9E6B0|nr:DNA repair protein RadC [Methanohalophilus levihalophilus]MBP2029428.1 DNA repair protein RadC [Methanohalophilus levihalophilus]